MIKINGKYLSVSGVQVKLSFALIALFKKLKKANGNVVKDTDLMQYAGICSRMSLNQTISLLRKKLDKFDGISIATHPKAGYSLEIGEAKNVGFNYANIIANGWEGCVNLFYGDNIVACVNSAGVAVELNVKDKAKPIKIIQLIPMPDNYTFQSAIWGLGSDGVVYASSNDGWEVAIPLEFKKLSEET